MQENAKEKLSLDVNTQFILNFPTEWLEKKKKNHKFKWKVVENNAEEEKDD